ncbi:MAG: hypothetical protein RRC07_15155 [Anaerolineae bacterium]|nr:hypothetical protein [Anaerolineae bacterium]
MDNGTIILINGTSSSGKTAIVKAVQNVMAAPYLEARLDRFISSRLRSGVQTAQAK